ncbi:MAG: DUF4340 domain-containing protein [Pseudomonadota bacterium]
MSTRNIIILIVTAAVVIGAWQVSKTNAPTVDLASDTLYPELLDNITEIDSLLIRSSDSATKLVRSGEQWVLSNRDNFPAKFDNVKSTLLQIANTSVIERKTAVKEKYATLGVNDPTEGDAQGVRVDVTDKQGQQLVSLIVGNKRQGRALGEPNYYIRRVSDEPSYLVSGNLDISAQIDDWIDPDIADIDTARVRRITITPDGEESVVIEKSAQSDNFFTVQNIPEGFKAKSRATVSSLGALLLSVRFEDVISADKVADSTARGSVDALTFDGLSAKLERFDYQDNEYVRMSFAHNEKDVVAEPNSEGSDNESANEPAMSVADEVAALNTKTAGWLYKLPAFKMRMLDKRLTDLIEPQEEEDTDANEER